MGSYQYKPKAWERPTGNTRDAEVSTTASSSTDVQQQSGSTYSEHTNETSAASGVQSRPTSYGL
jgi:hypothetical protein